MRLPVDDALPALLDAVDRAGVAVLQAPPGTGKTTRVPSALADHLGGRVVVLEPRRVAARAAAARVAAERGGRVGDEVGYHVRDDRQVGRDTQVVFATEGLFLRQLVADPFLDGVRAVVLDEFHERSVDADLALALCRSVRDGLRPDLVLVVMSATLDPAPLARFLGAPVLTATAPLHPLQLRYLPRPPTGALADAVTDAVASLPPEHSALVFLPGKAEIARCAERIPRPTVALHGGLTLAEQARVLAPTRGPRVVLATNLAESSVTVPGVRAVIDSGVARVMRFDPNTGIDRLRTEPIALDSADQRAGRAAREGPGLAIRLWTARDHADRPAHTEPSLHRTDLAPALLLLHAFGEPDPRAFGWFERPSDAALDAASAQLERLGLVRDGRLTPRGERLGTAPLHPRLARFVDAADRLGSGRWAARLALAMADGAPLRGELDLLDAPSHPRVARLARTGGRDPAALRRAALAAWPDRLAMQRGEGAVRVGGGGLVGGLHPLFVAIDLHPTQRTLRGELTVTLQTAVDADWLEPIAHTTLRFDGDRVVATDERRVGDLVLHSHPAPLPQDGRVAALLLQHATPLLPSLLPDDAALRQLLGRLRFVAHSAPHPELPDGTPASLQPVLAGLCATRASLAQLRKAPWAAALRDHLGWAGRQHLDEHAPEHVTLGSGARCRLDYDHDDGPVLAARIQALMGTPDSPRIGGRPVLVHLLAPNGRPQQITRDLANFWSSTYFEVRKELRRRYPKHPWPDDPTTPPAPRRR